MTPRRLARTRISWGWIPIVAGLAIPALTGCDPRQAMFFLQPFDPKIAPECPSLKGKRVVVLTSAAAGTQNDFLTIDREISRELTKILKSEIKRIDIVDSAKVEDWVRAKPSWTDPADAAKAFDADAVIFVEIRNFQIQSPRDVNVLEGKSAIHVQVIEMAHPKDDRDKPMTDKPKEPNVIYEGDRDTSFPVTGGIPIESGMSKTTFKNKFLKVVVTELSWHFVGHAPGDNIHDSRMRNE